EALALVVVQCGEEELLVGRPRLAILLLVTPFDRRLGRVARVVALGNDVVNPLDIGDGVLEGDALGVLLAPLVERSTDWLGVLEAGDIVTGVAPELRDGLAANVPLELVGPALVSAG